MLVISKGLHLNMFFSVKSLYVEYNIHSVALHLFAVQECHPLAYFQTTRVSKAIGTNSSTTPSRVRRLRKR